VSEGDAEAIHATEGTGLVDVKEEVKSPAKSEETSTIPVSDAPSPASSSLSSSSVSPPHQPDFETHFDLMDDNIPFYDSDKHKLNYAFSYGRQDKFDMSSEFLGEYFGVGLSSASLGDDTDLLFSDLV